MKFSCIAAFMKHTKSTEKVLSLPLSHHKRHSPPNFSPCAGRGANHQHDLTEPEPSHDAPAWRGRFTSRYDLMTRPNSKLIVLQPLYTSLRCLTRAIARA
jgi:hypothetical protein